MNYASDSSTDSATNRRRTDRYLREDSASRSLYERALQVMPGGNSRHTLVMDPYPVYATSGHGCMVTDVEGQERSDLIDEHGDDLAAVLLDPLPAALGLIPPHTEFVSALRAKTKECGALLIADEVLSFRIDYRGACHLLGIEPDLVALGKIIGGGFPVGAVAGKAEVMSVFDHRGGELVHHGGTYNGNPVTMVAGYETMKRLTPDVFAELDRLGDRVRRGLGQVLGRHGIEAVATGRGSLFAVVPGNEPPRDFRAVFTARSTAPQLQAIAREMLNRGILLGSRGLFGALSTPMADEEIDRFLEAANGAAEYVVAE